MILDSSSETGARAGRSVGPARPGGASVADGRQGRSVGRGRPGRLGRIGLAGSVGRAEPTRVGLGWLKMTGSVAWSVGRASPIRLAWPNWCSREAGRYNTYVRREQLPSLCLSLHNRKRLVSRGREGIYIYRYQTRAETPQHSMCTYLEMCVGPETVCEFRACRAERGGGSVGRSRPFSFAPRSARRGSVGRALPTLALRRAARGGRSVGRRAPSRIPPRAGSGVGRSATTSRESTSRRLIQFILIILYISSKGKMKWCVVVACDASQRSGSGTGGLLWTLCRGDAKFGAEFE